MEEIVLKLIEHTSVAAFSIVALKYVWSEYKEERKHSRETATKDIEAYLKLANAIDSISKDISSIKNKIYEK